MPTKETIDHLAVLGGKPAFEQTLHVGRPNLGNRARLMERIEELLDRRWLSNNGPFVQEFERKIARQTGAKHCIAMCNGTIALEIAIRACDLKGEVIVPSFTFIATAHALQWQEITPVFCDVDPVTHCLDPEQVERMITPRTTGILGVHLWGQPCDIEGLTAIARRHNLKLLFDASHAFGCSANGQMIGNFGDAEVYSFHATKFVNAFEGGAILTNSDELAAKIRLMKNFGFAGYDNVVYVGTNGKMSEISAAMGLTGLESLDEFVAVNFRNYQQYEASLADLPGVRFFSYNHKEKNNYQYIVLEIDQELSGISRDLVLKTLWAENVLARRYFFPGCHKMEPYRSFFPHAGLLLPHTTALVQKVLVLPTGTAVSTAEIEVVCEIIRLAITSGAELQEKLAERG